MGHSKGILSTKTVCERGIGIRISHAFRRCIKHVSCRKGRSGAESRCRKWQLSAGSPSQGACVSLGSNSKLRSRLKGSTLSFSGWLCKLYQLPELGSAFYSQQQTNTKSTCSVDQLEINPVHICLNSEDVHLGDYHGIPHEEGHWVANEAVPEVSRANARRLSLAFLWTIACTYIHYTLAKINLNHRVHSSRGSKNHRAVLIFSQTKWILGKMLSHVCKSDCTETTVSSMSAAECIQRTWTVWSENKTQNQNPMLGIS